jgi:hypothetical protein
VDSAWVKLRRGRYFIGPYNATPSLTIVGAGPYRVLPDSCAAAALGGAAYAALDASVFEDVSAEEAPRLADARVLELARTAGVKNWASFERGTRLVAVDRDTRDEILITPMLRKRGYWEPAAEGHWRRLRRPAQAELGAVLRDALEVARL